MTLVREDKKCILNFGGETVSIATIWNSKREITSKCSDVLMDVTELLCKGCNFDRSG